MIDNIMVNNFKPRLLLLTRTDIKNSLGIDVIQTASNVVTIQKGILIGGGYREYVSAIYEIHGVSNGTPYSIRLYTTYGTGYALSGFQLDRDGDGITTRWGANLTLSEPDVAVYEKQDRFPKVLPDIISRQDLCDISKEQMIKLFDADNIDYCDEANKAPVITMLGDPMVTITATDTFTDPGVTATDDIDGDITANVIIGGDVIDTNVIGEYVITYTVADQFGVSSMAVRHIHVVANEPPVVTLVGDSVINIIEGHAYVEEGIVAQDTEDGDISANVVVSGDVVDVNTPGSYTVVYTVTDSHGGVSTLERTINIIANDAPVLTLVGDSPIELIQGETYTEPGYNATDTEDGNIAPSVTITGTVDTSVVGVYTLVYSVTDSGDKTTTATRIVNVIANTDPVITLLGDSTIEVLNGNMFVDPGFTASDLNQGDLTASVVVSGDTVDTTTDGTYVITYTVEDANGGITTATRTVTVRTNTAPTITLNGDAEIIMTVGESYVEPGATAVDTWDGDVSAGISITGTVDTSVPGNYNITYTVTDSDGTSTSESRLVKVLVNELPTITLAGDNPVEVYRGEAFYEPGYTASDAEDGDITSNVAISPQPLGTDLLGDVMRTYSVVDSNGGTASATRLVHVIEDEPPVITLLGDNPVMIYQGTTYTEAGATALDYREGDVTADIVTGGDVVDPNVPAVYQVSYTVTDSKGNTSVKTRAVTVQLNGAPVITLNGPSTIELIENQTYTELGATATDAEDGDVSASIVITGVVNNTVLGDYVITYKATDIHGVESLATRTVTVIVDQPPVITLAGDNPLRVIGGNAYVEPGYTASDDVDGDLTASVVVAGDTVNENLSGTYNITYSVTAANSASTIVTREVNVRFAPTITLTAGDMAIATGTPFVDPGFSAFDAEQGDISSDVVVSGDTVVSGTPGIYDITYSVTDTDGMMGSAARRVIVSDKPVITLIGGTPKIIKTGDVYTDLGASAFDTEDGNLNASIVTVNTVDANTSGTYTVTYDVTDSNGIAADTVTRTVVVSDQPVITLMGDTAIVLDVNSAYIEPGYTAYDFEDGDITANVIVNSNVDTAVPGDYTITYSVTDSNGISAETVSRAIKISTRPTIQVLGDNPIAIEYGTVWADPGYIATDAEDGDITASLVISGDTVDTTSVGAYSITYSVTDSSGLTGVASRIVNVSHAPTLVLSGPTTIAIGTGDAFVDPGYTASDLEDGNLNSSIVVSGDVVDVNTPGTYTVVYTITDSVGLSTSMTRTVIVSDIPTLTVVGDPVVVVEKGTAYTEQGATAVDGYGNDITSSIVISGAVDTSTSGNYVIIYTATDALGLSNTITRTITVSAAPVITMLGSPSVVVLLDDPYTDAGATASDLEDGDITASIVTSSTVNTAVVGTYTVTYTVQDSNFLSDAKIRDVIVAEQATLQVIGASPLTVEQGTTFTDPGVLATDPVDGDISANVVVSGDVVDTSTVGAYTVVYTITNSYGLVTTIQRVVNIKAKPVITLLGTDPLTVPLNGAYNEPGATATDLEDGDITSDIVISGMVDMRTLGTYTLTYDVTDSDGFNALPVTRTVHVEDVPSIDLSGTSTMIVELGTPYVEPGFTATDTEDGDISASVVVGGDVVDTTTAGSYVITYTITDSTGFTTTLSRTVNVTSKPVITLLGDATTALVKGDLYTDAGATATDAEDGDITSSIVVANGVDANTTGSYTITYNVTDSVGLAADTVTRTVVVHERPVITIVGNTSDTILLGSVYTEQGATASDLEDGDISASVVVAGDVVDTSAYGTYVVTYNVTDSLGATAVEKTRTIIVADAPSLTLTSGNNIYIPLNVAFTDPGATATDYNGVDITGSIVYGADTVDVSIAAAYTRVYTVTNSLGLTTTATRTINVIDAPTISLTGTTTVDLTVGDVYTDAGATATDGSGNDITSDIVMVSNVDTAIAGTYTVTYNVTDLNGTAAVEVTRTVIVNAIPSITLVGAVPYYHANGSVWTEPGYTASDLEDGDITASVVITGTVDTAVNGTYILSYTVTDSKGASLTVNRTVIVSDAPVITLLQDSAGQTSPVYLVPNSTATYGASAVDSAGNDISSSISITNPADLTTIGSYTEIVTATDPSTGITTTLNRVVNVVASIGSTVVINGTTPMPIPLAGTYTELGATATDVMLGDVSGLVTTTGTVDANTSGTYTITYSYQGAYDTAPVTATRTVEVSTKPIITLAADGFGNTTAISWPVGTAYVDPGYTATDVEDGDITASVIVGGDVVDGNVEAVYVVTYNVTDNNGVAGDEVTRTVTVEVPNAQPVITLLGSDPFIQAVGTLYNDQGVMASDSEDGTITSDVVTVNPVDINVAGTYIVTYNVVDSDGYAAEEVTRTVIVDEPPVITLDGLNPIGVVTGDTYTEPGYTALDNEDGDITANVIVNSDVDTSTSGTYHITYDVTDSNGLSATQQTRTVVVTIIPAITPNDPPPVYVLQYTPYPDPGATAVDGLGNDISADVVTNGFNVDTNVTGSYPYNYTVTDSLGLSGIRYISVFVMSKPVITLVGDATVGVVIGTSYTEQGATAIDYWNADITDDIVVGGDTVDPNVAGTYTITYNVVDFMGFPADEVTRTVMVSTAPVITLVGDANTTILKGDIWSDPGYVGTDVEDGDITASVIAMGEVFTDTYATYTITYNLTDSAGLQAIEVIRYVTVGDPPVLTLTGDDPQYVLKGNNFTEQGATAVDYNGDDISANIVYGAVSFDTNVLGTYSREYTITNSIGLSDTATRSIIVIDRPVITMLGTDPVELALNDTYTDAGATAVDYYGVDITSSIQTVNNVDTSTSGTYYVTYDVVDSYGYMAYTVARTVNVAVANGPTITLLGDNPYYMSNHVTFADPGWLAEDTDGNDLTFDVVTSSNINLYTVGTYTVTYLVTDNNGASTTVEREVVIYGEPEVTILGDNPLVVTKGSTYTDPGATATDFEDGDITSDIVVGGDTVDPNVSGNYNVTYTVTDVDGHAVTETRVVTVNTPPEIFLNGTSPMYVEWGTVWTDPGTIAVDSEDGNITGQVVVSGGPDMSTKGTYVMTYTITDSYGVSASTTRTVIVAGTPAIYLEDDWASRDTPVYIELNATPTYSEVAVSEAGADITSSITTVVDADLTTLGTYTEEYNVVDPDTGLDYTEYRSVHVVDSVASTVTVVGDSYMILSMGDTYTELGATTIDIVWGDVSGDTLIGGDTVDTNVDGIYTITYSYQGAYDTAPVTATRTVEVQP